MGDVEIGAIERALTRMMLPIERSLNRIVLSIEDEAIRRLAQYTVGSAGKRLRPALLILAYEAVGGRRADTLVADHAAAVELVHTSSIVIDDIIDGGRMRRTIPPLYVKYGPFFAIVVASTLMSKAFEVFSRHPPIASLIARTVTTMNEGESLDIIRTIFDVSKDEEYLEIIQKKSASLISASPTIGGILAGGSSKTLDALSGYGYNMGLAFQIRDDVLGLTSTEEDLGKPVGSDLRERRPTLYLIHAFRHLDAEGRRRLRSLILENPLKRGRPYKEVIAETVEILGKTNSLEYSDRMARDYAERAKAHLSLLPPTPAREALLRAADYAVARAH